MYGEHMDCSTLNPKPQTLNPPLSCLALPRAPHALTDLAAALQLQAMLAAREASRKRGADEQLPASDQDGNGPGDDQSPVAPPKKAARGRVAK